MNRCRLLEVLALASILAACPDRSKNSEGGGDPADAAVELPDAGTVDLDAAVPPDAAEPPDAASPVDAAEPPDAGCAPGQVVDGTGRCRTLCSRDDECASGEACSAVVGMCLPRPVAPCNPARCPQGYVCPDLDGGSLPPDAGNNGCVPGPGYCAGDRDCPFTERCQDHRCISRAGDIVQVCGGDAGCPVMMQCQFGVCVGCLADIQCQLSNPDSRCLYGTCVTSTVGNAVDCLTKQCAEGTRCNPQSGQCEPTCASSADCNVDAGQMCAPLVNRCIVDFGCTGNEQCGDGLTCSGLELGLATGVCTGCSDAVPCRPGLTCVLSSCFPDMGSSACAGVTCPGTELCDSTTGACYPANGSCQDNADCRTGHTCNFLHLCSGCSVDNDCRPDQHCIVGTCVPF